MRHIPSSRIARAERAPLSGALATQDSLSGRVLTKNVRLQYLRGAAALAVLLFHASGAVQRFQGSGAYLAVFSGFWGAYGVAVFFALSGYLMGEIIQREDPARFLASRIARIYPPLLLVVGVFSIVMLCIGLPRSIDVIGLTLSPAGGRDYFLAVEWTLVYEMSYYTSLAGLALLGLRKLAVWFAGAWICLIIGPMRTTGVIRDSITPLASELPFQVANLPFLFGFMMPALARRGLLPPGLIFVAVPAALFAAYVIPGDERLRSAVPAILLVAAAIRSPKALPNTVIGRIGEKMGDASYMLYLSHASLLLVIGNLIPAEAPAFIVWITSIACAIILALALARADIEMHRRFKALIAVAPSRRLTAVALGFMASFVGVATFSEIHVRAERDARDRAAETVLVVPPINDPTVRAEVDSVDRFPDGTLVVRGYAIDLDDPDLGAHVAIVQRGQIVALDKTRRMRAALARSWSRPEIAGIRFGFVLLVPTSVDCKRGDLEVRVILDDGRVLAPHLAPSVRLCG